MLAGLFFLGCALASCGKDGGGDGQPAPASSKASQPAKELVIPPDLPFDPKGWTTVANYKPYGDPRAKRVPDRTFTKFWESFPSTLRTEGPNANTTEMESVHNLMYESLIQVDPETDEFIPCLASHWKIETHADGKQTLTFRISEKARFADGRPVQADDVYWTWWHFVQEDRNEPSKAMTFGEGYEEPKVLDRLTISVDTKKPNWRLFLYFGGMTILSGRQVHVSGERYLEDYNWKFVTGSGPYVMKDGDLKKGESLTLTRRTDWWAENEPWGKNTYNFTKVRWIVIRDLELAYEMFKKGELDWFQVGQARRWVEDVPKEKLVQKGWVQRTKVYNKRRVGFSGLAFNTRMAPFNDKRVRLAFAHLFNRERLMEKLFFNQYEMTNSTQPNSDWGSGDTRPRIVFDPSHAEELLAEAGYKQRDSEGWLIGPDGKQLEVTLEFGSPTWERIWLVVKEDYERAGVKFNLKLIDASTLQKKISERQFTIHFQPWGSILFPNPETSWRSSLADQPNNNNITGFKNARVDELCVAYNLTLDRAEQKKIIREIDTIVSDECHYAYGWHARFDRILYWDKFGHPDTYLTKTSQHPEDAMILLWWFDEAKEKALKEAMAADRDLPTGPVDVKPWG